MGMKQMRQFGQYVRQRYNGYLNDTYVKHQVQWMYFNSHKYSRIAYLQVGFPVIWPILTVVVINTMSPIMSHTMVVVTNIVNYNFICAWIQYQHILKSFFHQLPFYCVYFFRFMLGVLTKTAHWWVHRLCWQVSTLLKVSSSGQMTSTGSLYPFIRGLLKMILWVL